MVERKRRTGIQRRVWGDDVKKLSDSVTLGDAKRKVERRGDK